MKRSLWRMCVMMTGERMEKTSFGFKGPENIRNSKIKTNLNENIYTTLEKTQQTDPWLVE